MGNVGFFLWSSLILLTVDDMCALLVKVLFVVEHDEDVFVRRVGG